MSESVLDDILRYERKAAVILDLDDGPPVWIDDVKLFVRPMTLLERVAYRNWEYAHPDLPHHKGELFRRTVCDAAGNLTFYDDAADGIERTVDRYTLMAVWATAIGMLCGCNPNEPAD